MYSIDWVAAMAAFMSFLLANSNDMAIYDIQYIATSGYMRSFLSEANNSCALLQGIIFYMIEFEVINSLNPRSADINVSKWLLCWVTIHKTLLLSLPNSQSDEWLVMKWCKATQIQEPSYFKNHCIPLLSRIINDLWKGYKHEKIIIYNFRKIMQNARSLFVKSWYLFYVVLRTLVRAHMP